MNDGMSVTTFRRCAFTKGATMEPADGRRGDRKALIVESAQSMAPQWGPLRIGEPTSRRTLAESIA